MKVGDVVEVQCWNRPDYPDEFYGLIVSISLYGATDEPDRYSVISSEGMTHLYGIEDILRVLIRGETNEER